MKVVFQDAFGRERHTGKRLNGVVDVDERQFGHLAGRDRVKAFFRAETARKSAFMGLTPAWDVPELLEDCR